MVGQTYRCQSERFTSFELAGPPSISPLVSTMVPILLHRGRRVNCTWSKITILSKTTSSSCVAYYLPLIMIVVSSPKPEEPIPITTRDDESCTRDLLEPLRQRESIEGLKRFFGQSFIPQDQSESRWQRCCYRHWPSAVYSGKMAVLSYGCSIFRKTARVSTLTNGWKADWLIDPGRTIHTALLSCFKSEAKA